MHMHCSRLKYGGDNAAQSEYSVPSEFVLEIDTFAELPAHHICQQRPCLRRLAQARYYSMLVTVQ